ncbi:hypothetical protein, partial [Rhodobacter capsulatus]|uniref:hypothetical protein n=1 Tax=Rhodobacter capsulatus TaxID=1061 RepID=UPI001F171312
APKERMARIKDLNLLWKRFVSITKGGIPKHLRSVVRRVRLENRMSFSRSAIAQRAPVPRIAGKSARQRVATIIRRRPSAR